MATTPRNLSPLDRPGALIAALPAVLGFVPERSLVLVTAADGEMGAVLRADLDAEQSDWLTQLADLAATARPDVAIAVIVDEQGAECRMCAEEYRDVTQELTDELGIRGVELIAAHVVDRIAEGGRWYCADGCGSAGPVEDPTASPLALAAVLDGRRLYARRADLLEVVAPLDPRRAEELASLMECAGRPGPDRSDAEVRRDVEQVIASIAAFNRSVAFGDRELAQLGRSLTDPRVRDTLYALAVGDKAAAAESLWGDLARRLPAPCRAEALVLLAFSAYARGDGPLAGIALDAATRCAPGHKMAGMLDQALQSGIRPEEIRDLARTGYRLAAQLGVQLPSRRGFGQRAG